MPQGSKKEKHLFLCRGAASRSSWTTGLLEQALEGEAREMQEIIPRPPAGLLICCRKMPLWAG